MGRSFAPAAKQPAARRHGFSNLRNGIPSPRPTRGSNPSAAAAEGVAAALQCVPKRRSGRSGRGMCVTSQALPAGSDGRSKGSSGLSSHQRAPGLWSPPSDPAQQHQQHTAPQRGSVAARTEALRETQVFDSVAFSAAAMELDELVQRRARRQSLIDKITARRVQAGAVSWAVRSAVTVMCSASLVLDGSLHHMAHGYGIWAVITCINCNEKLQGDLFRKSMERAAGTLVGSSAAMFVLLIDDTVVPEFLGWNARADFYLVGVALFTIAGVYARSVNKKAPAMDYIYFMAVLSFDFLLLDSFSDLNEYQDGLERILMVCGGGLITCGVGTVLLPQYAGQELVALSASAFEGTATELEVTASALVLAESASTHGLFAQPSKIDMATVKRLVYLSHYEIRVFPPKDGKAAAEGDKASAGAATGSSLMKGTRRPWPRLSCQMPWEKLTPVFQAAQELRDVCSSSRMFLEAGIPSEDGYGPLVRGLSDAFEVELVVVVEEAAAVLRLCANRLRSSWKKSSRSSGVLHYLRMALLRRPEQLQQQQLKHSRHQPPPWDDVDEGLLRFEAALSQLHTCLRSCSPRLAQREDDCSLDVHGHYSLSSLQKAAVRLLAVRLREKVRNCVQAVRDAEAAGLLETPCPFPPTLK